MATTNKNLTNASLADSLDADGKDIVNANRLVVEGASGSASIHIMPGGAPTGDTKGIWFGDDVKVYRSGAATITIGAAVAVGGRITNVTDPVGDQDAATKKYVVDNFSEAGHTHDASDVDAGTLAHERGGLEADISAYGGLVLVSGGATSQIKANLVAVDDPDADDDSGDGYGVLSPWVNTVSGDIFFCANPTPTAAVWKLATDLSVGATALAGLSDVAAAASTANFVLATPNGAPGDYSGRLLVAADIPSLAASKIGSGTLAHERGGLEADVSAYSGLVLISSGSTSEVKANLTAVVDPDADDDSSAGYAKLSPWLNTAAGRLWFCVSPSVGVAVWHDVTANASALASLSDVSAAASTQNFVLATPNGAPGNYSGRLLVAADIPSLDAAKITSGTFASGRISAGSVTQHESLLTIAGSQVGSITASRALVSDSNGVLNVSLVTATELGYLDGVTSAIQTQLNALSASVSALDQVVVLKGTFTPSGGNFPGANAAQAGEAWIATDAGVIDGMDINSGDKVIAVADNASVSDSADWHLSDNTDEVVSVAGKVGAVTLVVADITDAGTAAGEDIGYFATAAQGALADSALQDLVDDLSPTLGGPLSVGLFEINSAAGNNIDLHSDNDVILELGDAAGANKVLVKDSGGVTVASIDSDGDFTGTLAGGTGLPISTGVSGLGTGVGTFLVTPSSANLLAAITGETGTGALVFAISPTLVTPVLGAATATSVNKIVITAPATGATLSLAEGSSLTTSGAFAVTLTSTGATSVTLPTTGTLLANLAEDLTPQLGAALDVNGFKFVSVSNGNIDLEPHGTGNVLLGNFTFDADQAVGVGEDNYILTYDHAAGTIGLEVAAVSVLESDTAPKLGGMLDVNGFAIGDGTRELLDFTETASAVNQIRITNATTGNGPTLSAAGDDVNVDLNLAAKGTGNVRVGNFTFNADQVVGAGQDNYVLTYDHAAGTIGLETTVNVADGATLATGLTFPNTGLHILDTGGDHDLIIAYGENASADRTLTFVLGNVSRTVTLGGTLTTGGTFTTVGNFATAAAVTFSGAYAFTGTLTATTSVTFPTTGTLMANLVEDTTPQLGGALAVNGQEITSAASADIDLHSGQNIIMELGDTAGADKVSIRDSSAVEKAYVDSDGRIYTAADLTMAEIADHATTPAAGKGVFWVKTGAPCTPQFTDDAGTDFNLATRAGIYRYKWYRAKEMTPRTTNGAADGTVAGLIEEGAGAFMVHTLDFDQTTAEGAGIWVHFGDQWDAGTIKIKVYWTCTSGSGDVVWSLSGRSFNDAQDLGQTAGTAVTVTDTRSSVNYMQITAATGAVTLTGATAGEPCYIQVVRDAGALGDTLTGDARLIGILVQYLESATESSAW